MSELRLNFTKPRTIPIDTRCLNRLATVIARRAEAFHGAKWREVVIHLLSDREMEPINLAIVGHTGATDVITQRYDTLPGEPDGLIGELFVDVEWALSHCPRRDNWSRAHEVLLYIAHGFDHLTGADDLTPEDRRRMRQREMRGLRKLEREYPDFGFFTDCTSVQEKKGK